MGSRIYGNDVGIFVDPVVPVFMASKDAPADTGGIGNAFGDQIAQSVVQVIPSSVTISNSSLAGNASASVKNIEKTSTVEAAHNWWGSANGPATSTIIGQVDYVPWLDHDPTLEATTTICCSSVLFLPGLEGTWLYRDEPGSFGMGTSTNTLWAPNRNDDVRKLFLNPSGSSTDVSIYSGEPVDNVFNIYSVYGSFIKFMNGLVASSGASKIGEWRSFGYDWRKPITEVVAGGEKRATTTESLIDVVTGLASRSKTGKITVVAHSNGGLVAKYLVKTLAEAGKTDLVDSVVSVAVPYLGTPAAISALLHGDHQAIANGLILSASVARQLGQNMSSAYSLLPSREYFSHVLEPVISFASSTTVDVNNGVYAQFIKSYGGMTNFIDDTFKTRQIPSASDTEHPLVGNSVLTFAGDAVQTSLANFSWPENIRRWSLVGWDKETPKTLVYSDKEKCAYILWFKLNCQTVLERSETETSMGDGTVVAPSAAYGSYGIAGFGGSGTTTSIDLATVSKIEGQNFDHVNILESSTTQSIIRSILTGQTASVFDSIGGVSALPGVSLGEPDYSKEPVHLAISVDADAELHVQDGTGKHTGVIEPPAGVDDNVAIAYEENVSGSHFSLASESDTVNASRISLPDNGQQYSVVVRGGSFGSFTLNVDRVQGVTSLGHIEFTDIPMTPLSIATTTILVPPAGSLVASTSVVSLDIDGDGTTDFVATSTIGFAATSTPAVTSSDQIARLELFKKFASTTLGQGDRYRKLAKRFDNIEDLMKKGRGLGFAKKDWSRDFIQKFTKKFGHKHLKRLTDNDRRDLADTIDSLVGELER